MNLTHYLLICFSITSIVRSAKILVVVPTPSISHQVVFRPLIQELANLNHEVIVITTDPVKKQGKSANNLREIDVHDLSYDLWNKMRNSLKVGNKNDFINVLSAVFRELSAIFWEQLKDISVQQLITDKTLKFDLLIVEACVIPTLIFSHIFKAPIIQMSSFGAIPGNMETVGSVIHPFLYPTHYHQRVYNLTIWEKIMELYNHVAIERMLKNQEVNDNEMLKSIFGPDTPSLNQLKHNVDMLFLNVHPIWMDNQPVPPNVIFTWGIHKNPEKILPKDLQSYLDSSKNGVIYVSFGTNVSPSSIPLEKLKIFLKVFSQLPYEILLKWDKDELPGKSENIRISKWFPQSDVLRHPNLKLFITQGGLQSTDEAINADVPLIGIPMFADQEYNTEKYAHFKIGLKLKLSSLTEEIFKKTIDDIFINYESYRSNIIKLRKQMYDHPKPPLENAIWWIDHVLRHGGAEHLRTPAANMSWIKYYEVELVFIVLSAFLVLGAVLLFTIYFCYKSISDIKKKVEIMKKKNS